MRHPANFEGPAPTTKPVTVAGFPDPLNRKRAKRLYGILRRRRVPTGPLWRQTSPRHSVERVRGVVAEAQLNTSARAMRIGPLMTLQPDIFRVLNDGLLVD